jgi:glyoxylase-like metal-dependent hydrolase (beta-lactamase superfamily II)
MKLAEGTHDRYIPESPHSHIVTRRLFCQFIHRRRRAKSRFSRHDFLLSEAILLADRIAELRKPLAAILITHPHPDRYNGLASIQEKLAGTQVYATPGP